MWVVIGAETGIELDTNLQFQLKSCRKGKYQDETKLPAPPSRMCICFSHSTHESKPSNWRSIQRTQTNRETENGRETIPEGGGLPINDNKETDEPAESSGSFPPSSQRREQNTLCFASDTKAELTALFLGLKTRISTPLTWGWTHKNWLSNTFRHSSFVWKQVNLATVWIYTMPFTIDVSFF